MKIFQLGCLVLSLIISVFPLEYISAKNFIKVDRGFYTSTAIKGAHVDEDLLTGVLGKKCDNKEYCQVFLDKEPFDARHPGLELHVSYHCECSGRKCGDKTAKANNGLIAIECAELPPSIWGAMISFTGDLIKSWNSSNRKPTAAEAVPLVGDKHHQKSD